MTEIIVSGKEFDNYLRERIDNINISLNETRAYIHSIFRGQLYTNGDLSKESVTLYYGTARCEQNFNQFQKLADWIFFIRSGYHESLRASPDFYDTIARSAYYRCYIILDKKWPCFEELSDRFEFFVEELRTTNIVA